MSRTFPGGTPTTSNPDRILTTLSSASLFAGAHSIHMRYYRRGAGGNNFGRCFSKWDGGATTEVCYLSQPSSIYSGMGGTNADTYLAQNAGGDSFGISQDTFNAWMYVLIVLDASGPTNFPTWYLNGVSQTVFKNAGSGGVSNTAGLCIGNRDFDQARCFDGFLAEFAVWSALLPATAATAMAAGASPVEAHPDNLVAYWPMLGDSPEPDYSGSRLNGTVTATTISNHPGVRTGMAAPRKFGASLFAAASTANVVYGPPPELGRVGQ